MSRPTFTNESLCNWLKSQNPKQKYRYEDCHNCMLCQYFTDKGMIVYFVSNDAVFTPDGTKGLPRHWRKISEGNPKSVQTFGKALKRLEKLMEAENGVPPARSIPRDG